MSPTTPIEAYIALTYSLPDVHAVKIAAQYAGGKSTLGEIGESEGELIRQAAETVSSRLAAAAALIPLVGDKYEAFSDSGKAAFGGAYDAVISHLKRGDVAAAKLAIYLVQIPASLPGVTAEELATWAAKKDEILALFP